MKHEDTVLGLPTLSLKTKSNVGSKLGCCFIEENETLVPVDFLTPSAITK